MNRLVKHKNVCFDKNGNSTEPSKFKELVLTSAYRERTLATGQHADCQNWHEAELSAVPFAYAADLMSFSLMPYSFCSTYHQE